MLTGKSATPIKVNPNNKANAIDDENDKVLDGA